MDWVAAILIYTQPASFGLVQCLGLSVLVCTTTELSYRTRAYWHCNWRDV